MYIKGQHNKQPPAIIIQKSMAKTFPFHYLLYSWLFIVMVFKQW